MKNLLKIVVFFGLVTMMCTCTPSSAENSMNENQNQPPCVNEDPITRVVNNGTIPFDFKVFDSNGVVIINIPNIPANTTTSWASFTEGEVLFSVSNNDPNFNDDKVELQMDTCMAYDIEIDGNNEIVSYIPTTL